MSLASTVLWPLRTLAAMLLQPDKISHIYWGATIGFSFGLWMHVWALMVVAIFAAAKELYDLRHPPHDCDVWDFVATLLGGASAIGVIFLHARHQ